jgi:eukaryotic-like serine/threonine-protein kinase
MLSAPRMAQMNRLLDEALDMDAQGRRRWLEALSPEYEDLKPALQQALLPDTAAANSGNLATLPKLGAADGATEVGSGLQAGEMVGPYRLVRPLGAGGMAEVWLAQRADGAFKREVALKLPMLSRLRRDLASRFARERDILAGLEHPNIARLYDAGVSLEGLPYLAMEHVHGEPLTGWCNRHRLGIRERLKLFLQVLDAVQYAHGHQVIHRDIKPSNILVTDSGQARLLDFGVAKLLAEEDEHTELTQIYGRALTPDYASPEQVRGEVIDAAADVYSLGVVVYELLAGSRPYHLKAGASITLLEQAIVTAPVERPSTQVGAEAGAERSTTQQKLARRLRGDLDAIVLKALAKAPSDRYSSAAALADDLQRYLSGEPVEARPDRLLYRAGKFVLRHPKAVPATAVLVLLFAAMGYELIYREPPSGQPASSAKTTAGQNLATLAPTPFPVNDKSIAVLPFVDMSEKKDQEYFSDGLSEELIDHLSHSADLKVIARTSSFQFKGKNEDVRTIAGKLAVANLLEGSVRKDGKTLRITAQLIRASDGTHLWSQTYDRTLVDIFKVQDEIATTVAQALKVSLLGGFVPKGTGSRSAEAYELFLQAKSMLRHASTAAANEKAVDQMHRAIELDPRFAPAWAQLSNARFNQAQRGFIPGEQVWSDARRAAERAIALDPKLADGYTCLTRIQALHEWDWAGAQTHLVQALVLDPGNAGAISWAGALAQIAGQGDAAREFIEKGISLDPMLAYRYGDYARLLFYMKRDREALAAIRKLHAINSDEPGWHAFAGIVMAVSGDPAHALAEINNETDEESRQEGWAITYQALGQRNDSDAALAALEEKFADSDSVDIAEVHAFRGEIDQAFAWLDRAIRQREPYCVFIKTDRLLENLRGDPRYRALLRKMRLPE